MGSGLSSDHPSSAALVVAADGSLREFAPGSSPASVSDVLAGNAPARSFLCSSDALYFGAAVPPLGADELLRPGQIYLVLPVAMIGRPLSSAAMAALALRASQALAGRPRARAGRSKARRVLPLHHAAADEEANEKLNQRTLGGFEAPSPGIAKTTAAPMRRALSTIVEDAD